MAKYLDDNGLSYLWQKIKAHVNTAISAIGKVPTGGTAGQILAKASGTDFDTEWVTNSGGSGSYLPLAGGEMSGNIINKFSNGAIAKNTTTGTNQLLETVAHDQSGAWFASFVQQLDANRRTRISMSLRNMNNSGTWISNGLFLYVAKDGTPTVTVDQPAAWRTGIGANNASNLTTGTIAQARLLNNNWTYGWGSASGNYCRYCKIGHIVYVEVGTNAGHGTNAGQTYTLCTLPSGFRPVGQNATNALYNYGGTVGMIDVLTGGNVNIKCTDGCSWWWGIIAFPVF